MADDLRLDVRIVRMNIDRGVVDRKEYDTYLKDLEDCADDAVPSDTQFIRTDARSRAPVEQADE